CSPSLLFSSFSSFRGLQTSFLRAVRGGITADNLLSSGPKSASKSSCGITGRSQRECSSTLSLSPSLSRHRPGVQTAYRGAGCLFVHAVVSLQSC
ncbi:hypothetical protein CSUI_008879, partial [Cystoisospora suis]